MTTGINELTSTEQGVTPAVLESLASDVQAVREQLISSGVPLGRKPRHDFGRGRDVRQVIVPPPAKGPPALQMQENYNNLQMYDESYSDAVILEAGAGAGPG